MSPINTPSDEQSSQQLAKKIIALFLIPAVVFAVISCREGLNDQQIADLAENFNFSKFGAPANGAIITFLLLLFSLFLFRPFIRFVQKLFSLLTGKYFVISLAALAFLGAGAALYIPSYTSLFKTETQQSTSSPQPTQNGQGSGSQQNQSPKDPSSDLRLHLLYITGGVIAVLGLIETNRKNSQDHIRQVHAARRERYIEAVDKLSSEQAPVRLGGVYALVGLVDEWLDDDNIDEKIRTKEGQIIINNLCSYIRSPFSLAEKREILEGPANMHVYSGNLNEDKAKLREEQDVRRTIFEEMSKRSSDFTSKDRKIVKTFLDPWNKFDFDFTQSQIFYPLNNLTIEQGNFSYAIFYGQADFSGSSFIRDTAFNGVHFTQIANFNKVTFNGKADFSTQGNTKTVFVRKATFNGTLFIQGANFNEVTFNEVADFSAQGDTKTVFGGDATFNSVLFIQGANFNEVTFNEAADFSAQGDTKTVFGGDTTFNGTQFTQKADFNEVVFNKVADFSTQGDTKTTFGGDTTFNGVQFAQGANFNEVTFNEAADFSTQGDTKTTFGGKATFNGTHFAKKTKFNEVTFHEVTFNESTDLSIQNNPKTIFGGKAVFNDATFNREAVFYGVLFKKAASFKSVLFCKNACFKYAIFKNSSSFTIKDTGCRKTEFKESADFQSTLFKGKTSFKGAIFNGRANFYPNQLDIEDMKFAQEADFSYAHFMKGAHFLKVEFEGDALFGFSKFHEDKTHEILIKSDEDLHPSERLLIENSMTHTNPDLYTGTANFCDTEFHGFADFALAEFAGESIFASAKFYQRVSFWKSCIYKKIVFLEKLDSIDMPAYFSNKNKTDDYNFDSKEKDNNGNELYIIKKDEIPYGDEKFYVPEGCKLFDPDAPKDLFGNYKQSDPAEPIEESDNQGETPPS